MAIGLTARQRVIIAGTIREARTRYASQPAAAQRRAAAIAVSTMFVESGCRVLANANVPVSLKITHDILPWSSDGLGHDHASVGSYQQQTGTAWTVPTYMTTMGSANGWGTPYELMDPPTAAKKFFHAMDQRGGAWKTQPEWVTSQNVQVSAFDGNPRAANNYSSVYGGNYRSSRTKAYAAVALLWVTSGSNPAKPAKPLPASKPPKKVKKPAKYVKVRDGQTLSIIAAHQSTTWQHLVTLNVKRYPTLKSRPDFIKPGWKLRVR